MKISKAYVIGKRCKYSINCTSKQNSSTLNSFLYPTELSLTIISGNAYNSNFFEKQI